MIHRASRNRPPAAFSIDFSRRMLQIQERNMTGRHWQGARLIAPAYHSLYTDAARCPLKDTAAGNQGVAGFAVCGAGNVPPVPAAAGFGFTSTRKVAASARFSSA